MAVRAEHQHHHGAQVGQNTVLQSILSAILTLTATLGFLIALVATAVVAYGLMYQNQVYPGVQAAGIEIGGVTPEEAQAALDERTAEYLSSEVTLVSGDQTFTTTPAELGVTFDTARTIERANEFGRAGSWWTDSRDWFDSLVFGHDVGVTPVIDSSSLEAYFQSISGSVGARPQEPTFRISDDGQLEITPSAAGLGIDLGDTGQGLRQELSVLGDGPVEISTIEVEPAYTEDALDPMGQRIEGIVSEQFILERGDYQWALDAERLDAILDVSINSQTGESELSIDHERLRAQLETVAEDAYSDGRDARVSWDGDSFEVTEAREGWRIDVDQSVDIVADAILDGEHRAELATTSSSPAITTDAAEEAADYGNQLASSPFSLKWSEGETELGGTVIAAALSLTHDPEQGTITPEVNIEDLTMFLSSITPDVNERPVSADLRYFNGDVVVRSEEQYGWEMDREASAQAIAEAIENGETSAEIVVNEAEPEVTAAMADDIEIRDMLSSAETYYGGSAANRAHNVELATELANGALIPPGGTYSFNESIGGEITEEVGFAQGFGIEGATDGGVTTVPTIGGGVCQVSTTVFQAAFWAGMPIVERNWHMYWMPSYGQPPSGMTGLDATIATGAGLDFKFENTTGDWIAIVASANGNADRFEIWGTDPGWDVQASEPQVSNRVSASSETVIEESDEFPVGYRAQVESAHDGFDVVIDRQVYDSDGELIDDLSLESRYKPASNRVLVGTGD